MKPNIQTMNEDDYWDCPYCEQPMPPEHDKECHCGMRVSHHLSVPALCKQLREAQQRESSLIVRKKKLEDEVNEQARLLGMSGERECDLRGEMNRMKGLLIRLYNDLFIIHNGVAIADLKKEFREENYN